MPLLRLKCLHKFLEAVANSSYLRFRRAAEELERNIFKCRLVSKPKRRARQSTTVVNERVNGASEAV